MGRTELTATERRRLAEFLGCKVSTRHGDLGYQDYYWADEPHIDCQVESFRPDAD